MGVVGTLQFDVFQYRLRNEYNVEIRMDTLPYEYLRWIKEPVEFHETDLVLGNDIKLVEDYKGNKLLLFSSFWSIKWVSDHNPQLVLTEFSSLALPAAPAPGKPPWWTACWSSLAMTSAYFPTTIIMPPTTISPWSSGKPSTMTIPPPLTQTG